MTVPLVSVVMAAYNHEPFVAEAVQSVLSQRSVDFEFLIADDGSSDRTGAILSGFSDRRISFFPNALNRGACTVLNELIGKAQGKYIAIINSDDAWLEDKLAYQVDLLEARPEIAASFGRVRYFGRDSKPINEGRLHFGSAFNQENRSSAQWLRQFFDRANCLCHPSLLIRRHCYDDIGNYNNRLRQLPDFEMWVRLLKRFEIHVSSHALVKFRIVPGENVSSQVESNAIRTMNEHFLVAETFFEGMSRQSLLEGFGDLLRSKELPTEAHKEIEQALLYFVPNKWFQRPYQMIGLLKLNHLLNSPLHQRLLDDYYGINDAWFQGKMAEVDVLRPKLGNVVRSSAYLMRDFIRKTRMVGN